MEFQIDDLQIYQAPKVARRIQIHVAELSFNKHVLLRVLLFGNEEHNMNILDVKMIRIDGDEYKAWGSDDTYIEKIVFEKLGIHKRVMKEEIENNEVIENNEGIEIDEEALNEPLQT